VEIDISSREELIAAYKTFSNVEAVINTDSLGYVSNEGLVKAICLPEENLCMGCLNSVLPLVNTG
jgi:amidophosphoribosyltransferase